MTTRTTLALAVLCTLPLHAQAADTFTTRDEVSKLLTFEVAGYGKQFFAVDMANLVFSVSTRDKNAGKAKAAHDESVAKVKAYIAQSPFKDDRIQLKSTQLTRLDEARTNSPAPIYECKSVFAIRTGHVDELGEFQARLVENGVDEIAEAKLFNTKQREQEDEARKLAFADAKQKAELSASQLGWTLGKVVAANLQESRWSDNDGAHGFGSRAGGGGGVSQANLAGADYVESTVTLTFVYAVK